MTGHHIVCGFGHVGYRIVPLLRRLGVPVCVVYDQAPEAWLREAEALGACCLQGDAQDDQLLQRAGIQHARAVIAVTDRDLVNLSVALDAKRLNPGLTPVVRLFDRDLAHHVEESLISSHVLSTSALAAPVFVSWALGEDVIGSFRFQGAPFALHGVPTAAAAAAGSGDGSVPLFRCRATGVCERLPGSERPPATDGFVLSLRRAPAGGPAAGPAAGRAHRGPQRSSPRLLVEAISASLRGLPLAVKAVILLLAVVVSSGVILEHAAMGLGYLDALYLVVTTITTVGYGDLSFLQASPPMKLFGCFLMLSGAALLAALFGVVTDAILTARFRGLLASQPVRKRGHVIVTGAGHVGLRVVQQLLRDGYEAAIVCDPAGDLRSAIPKAVPLVEGDARGADVLRRAGVEHARAVVATGDDDVANLGIGLQARRTNPAVRTVVRVFDGALASKLQGSLGLDQALSVSAVAAPTFVAASLLDRVEHASVWCGHLLVVQTAQAPLPDRGPGLAVVLATAEPPSAAGLRPVADPGRLRPGEDVVIVRLLPLAPLPARP